MRWYVCVVVVVDSSGVSAGDGMFLFDSEIITYVYISAVHSKLYLKHFNEHAHHSVQELCTWESPLAHPSPQDFL